MNETIALAGGCFWGVQHYFRQLKGVIKTRVGYCQGHISQPTYEQVCSGKSGHCEAVLIEYDPLEINTETLLKHLFQIIDPTSLNQQGNDKGVQYRSGIYTTSALQFEKAQTFLNDQQAFFKKPLVVELATLQTFYDAEKEHQDYLVKNPYGYCHVDCSIILEHQKK